ncbi:zinc finger C2H2 type [Schistosoma japonicum]|uniref:Zinc finger C2H2 type n=1 Tax=Schistosoma japonicum TaxID=6182 RepID=A0A4Z2DQP1_SCHJA|nr:zinc finger C2H2 type [Schistosoma japonicum]
MTTTSPVGLTHSGLSVKLINSDYHISEPISVDIQSMDVDSCGPTQWDTGSSNSTSHSLVNNDEVTMKLNELDLLTSNKTVSNNSISNNTTNTTHKMNTLSYIPPGLISFINESNCLTVCAIGHFSIGHTWGPYLIHIGSELRQKLTTYSSEFDPDFLITLNVKSKDSNQENVNSLTVGEEHTWIKVIHETGLHSNKNEHNLDILVDPILKTITLQTKSDINPQDCLIGVVRIVSDNQKSDQLTISSNYNSTFYNNNNTKLSSSTSSSSASTCITSTSNNLSSYGPRRDKKCTYCGISFSNLDTLNAHMTHYCSRRPGLISTTSTINQPIVSISVTNSDTLINNKNTTNKYNHNSINNQRQSSSQSFGSNSMGFNFPVNSNSSSCAPKYNTAAGNNSDSNSMNMSNGNLLDPIKMSNLINPTLLNLFGTGDATAFSQMFQNPLAYFMLPMLSRLIPSGNSDFKGDESYLNAPISSQSASHPMSPTAMKRPQSPSDKMKSSQSSDFTAVNNSFDIRVSPTQSNISVSHNNKSSTSEQQTPRILFCPNCQQLYTSQYLSTFPLNSNTLEPFTTNRDEMSSVSHANESIDNMLHSNDMVWTLSQLSAVAHRYGLILAAPLVTANGLQYIPVNLTSKFSERYSSEKCSNNKNDKNNNNNNNHQTVNKKGQCITPTSLYNFTSDSLNSMNNSNSSPATLSPSASLTCSTSIFGNKQPESPLTTRLNTPNILDLSANPSNSQSLNSFTLYNAINEFRDNQHQQQQQNYCQSQLSSQKKNDNMDILKVSNSCTSRNLSLPNNPLQKVSCNLEDIHNDHTPLLDNQTSTDINNSCIDKNLLQMFYQILTQSNSLSTNSQTIQFPFNVNQLLLLLYASLATNSMNFGVQSSLNVHSMMNDFIPSTVTNIIPINNNISPSMNVSTSMNTTNTGIKMTTDNCDNSTMNSTVINSIQSNLYKKFSSLSSLPFTSICVNPLISSSDQLMNTSNINTIQNSFPIFTTPTTTSFTSTITNIPTHISQNLTCSSSSINKLEINSINNIGNNKSNNINDNDNNNNNNNTSVLNLLPALKLLGTMFPQMATVEQNQQQKHESHIQQIIPDTCSNLKHSRLSTRGMNSEQLTSPPTSPQPSVLRPYLCRFCRTRFQAFSTFQAHQQFYCQGRKEVMKHLQTTTTNSVTSHMSYVS